MRFRRLLLLLLLFSCTPAHQAANISYPDNVSSHTGNPGRESAGEIWFVPNPNSADFLQLFNSKPDRWPQSRNVTDVFMFYRTMLDGSCRGADSPICGPNTLDNLIDRQAFQWLSENGLKIATTSSVIMNGGESQRDCNGRQNLNAVLNAIWNVKKNGGRIDAIDMDEPWNKSLHEGSTSCFQESQIKVAAAVVQRFVNSIHHSFSGDNIRIGLTEPYPESPAGGLSPQQIERWVDALQAANVTPDFFHLDIDMNKLRSHSDRLRPDLIALNSYFKSKGIPFGVIFWGGEARSDCEYSEDAMKIVENTKQAIGIPDHSLYMSFSRAPTPRNLPEWDRCTHTDLILEGSRRFQSPSSFR